MKPDAALARAIATWLGCGYWPWGPGTLGALAAIAIAVAFHWSPVVCLLAAGVTLPIAIWAAGREAVESGRKDPGQVVVDEVVGQWIALGGAAILDWRACIVAFLLFRLFDIWKPAPVRQLEALPGGVGIMADDVMAGVYAAIGVRVAGLLHLY